MASLDINSIVVWAALGVSLCLCVATAAMWAKSRSRASRLQDYLQDADNVADFETAIYRALQAVMADLGANASYVMLADPRDTEKLSLAASVSQGVEFVPPSELSVEDGLSGLAVRNGQTILVRGKQQSGLLSEELSQPPSSALCIPLNVVEGQASNGLAIKQAAGTLVLATYGKAKPMAADVLNVASAYGTVLSMLVHNLKMIQFSRETILASLQEIADLLDAKDPYSVGHSRRTSELSGLIAENLGLDLDAVQEVRDAAKLLDLGKVAIPDSILKKNSGLTSEEFEVVKSHPLVSFEICRKLRLPESVLMIVRNHHERLDGTGYPDQLRGGELPLPLRIVTVADAYDAMRCPRPHRTGMNPAEALHQLVIESGTKFDPVVVESVRELTELEAFDHLYEQGFDQPQVRVA